MITEVFNSIFLVYPLYHEWADSILQLSDLRKFKFGTNHFPNKNGGTKKIENR